MILLTGIRMPLSMPMLLRIPMPFTMSLLTGIRMPHSMPMLLRMHVSLSE